MTQKPSDGVEPDGKHVDGWPARMSGVTETIVATMGPNGRWNQAALGISPGDGVPEIDEARSEEPVVARTYGRTRTRRNFEADRPAYVQFTTDPLDFVEAALGVYETENPIVSSAGSWTRADVSEVDRTDDSGTEIVEWSLRPIESGIQERSVPTLQRGRAAVIEATVPASRLGIDGYDDEALLDRLKSLADVVETASDERTMVAFERIDELVGWRDLLEEKEEE